MPRRSAAPLRTRLPVLQPATGPDDAADADVALPVHPGDPSAVEPAAEAWLGGRAGDAAAALARAAARGSAGEVVTLSLGATRVHLVGVGDGSTSGLRAATAAAVRAARDAARVVVVLPEASDATDLRAAGEAALLGAYAFPGERGTPRPPALREVALAGTSLRGADEPLARATVVGRAVERARDLVNTPSLRKTPAWLADRAADVAREAGLEVEVRDERRLAAEGFGGLLAVGSGSPRPPRLVELRYVPERPGRRRLPHVVLVGKGITFDSGGLSLKPAEAMVGMKTDMAGAAAVLAAMGALRDLGVRVRVTGLLAAAENMPSGTAQRPGDVVRHYDGTTVEVLNTDAEGRLVLADAIGYAARELRPDVVVDLATLTGAATLGLGRRHGALFATDDVLAGELVAAGSVAGEPAWRMPLVEDYLPTLESDVADLRNVGRPGDHFAGGAITAALFLRRFAAGLKWAHLDIAGPARADADSGEVSKGGTGYGTRLLLRWLETRR